MWRADERKRGKSDLASPPAAAAAAADKRGEEEPVDVFPTHEIQSRARDEALLEENKA